tara:strand:- start:12 stop:740 length:729 start_codon:yes stop_codon:yes gene_type:complete
MKNKTTLITGAGSGIGLAISDKFYDEKHNLILLVKTLKQKINLKRKYNSKFVRVYNGDLAKYSFIKKISKNISHVDNLINNAADRNGDHLFKVKKKELDYLIDLNFKSVFLLTKIFTEKMVKKKIKGSVVNISSQLGHIGAINRTAYCSTKFAIEGFTKSAAMDLGKYGIKINTIAPTKTIVNNKELLLNKQRLKIIKSKIPSGKFSKKEDIAELCLFLTSSFAHNITGSSLKIDGGWTAGK